jgi:subtilisin family serine protease
VTGPLALALAVTASPGLAQPHHQQDFVPDELLVGFRGGLDDAQQEDVYRGHGGTKLQKLRKLPVHRIRIPPAQLDAVEKALKKRPEVEFVERNHALGLDMTATDPYYGNEWHLPRIGAPWAWDVTIGAPEVVIAIVDTGVDGSHPDLAGQLVAGFNFYSNDTNTADVHGHGTWVAGAAAASSNNGVGVASVAWRSRIMPLRVTDSSGTAYYSTVANAITWAADHGARVISTSIGGVIKSSAVNSAAQYAIGRGAVVVASGGNCGCADTVADSPYIISVSATDQNDALASFSSRGNHIDVAAPGISIWTTARGGGYSSVYGTSFAAPIVAGTLALMRAANPALTPAELETLLQLNADDLGAQGWDPSFGSGRVNASRAVAAAGDSAPDPDTAPPKVSISSPGAGTTVSGTVPVSAAATDDTGVTSVALYRDGLLVGSDATAPYGFSWNTSQVGNGSHTLVAVAYDAAGNAGTSAAVTVTVQNATDAVSPTVSITSLSGSGKWLKIGVAASDNVGVARVEIYVDGKRVATDSAAPYAFSINVKSYAPGWHTVQARAFDAAGNSASSASASFQR